MKTKILGASQFLIFSAVEHLQPNASAPSIQSELKTKFGREMTMGQIYSTLDRAELSGLVSSAVIGPNPTRGGRRKRVFSLEEKGLRRLQITKSIFNKGAVMA